MKPRLLRPELFGFTPGVTGCWLLLLFLATVGVRQWVWMPGLIQGTSMWPTLHDGQIVGINRLAYAFGSPKRGDIVLIRTHHGLIVKRIIGLPGEELAIRRGRVFADGRMIQEPYSTACGKDIAAGTLEHDSFAVAGDNRAVTVIAVVGRKRILGRLLGGMCEPGSSETHSATAVPCPVAPE